MNASGPDAADLATLRHSLALAVAGVERCRSDAMRHQQEAERWQRRIALAEQRGEGDLATEAARLARQHAARALTALDQYDEQRREARAMARALEEGAPGASGALGRVRLGDPAEAAPVAELAALSLDEQLAALKRRLAGADIGQQ